MTRAYNWRPVAAAKRAAYDVERLRRYAAYVIEVSADQARLVKQDPGAPLTVVAVIGPAQYEDRRIAEAPLCEVGLFRGKPYRGALLGRKGFSGPDRIKRRHKVFCLSEAQYRAVAPIIFSLVQERTDEQVSRREFGPHNPRMISLPGSWWSQRHGNEVMTTTVKRFVPPGVRFSVSTRDSLLAADIYHAAAQNKETRQQMAALESLFTKMIYFGRTTPDMHRPLHRPFNRRKAAQNIRAVAETTWWDRREQHWLWTVFLGRLKPRSGRSLYFFRSEFAKLLGCPDPASPDARSPVELLAVERALSGAPDRYGKMRLRPVRLKGDVLTFEVFPDEGASVYERNGNGGVGKPDEIPF